MTPSEIISLRATCLQVALHEAQQGLLRISIDARAAQLARWVATVDDPEQSPMQPFPIDEARPSSPAQVQPGRAERAYHMQTPDGEQWWLFRSGLGEGKALRPMPDMRHARRVGSGKMAVRVEMLMSPTKPC